VAFEHDLGLLSDAESAVAAGLERTRRVGDTDERTRLGWTTPEPALLTLIREHAQCAARDGYR